MKKWINIKDKKPEYGKRVIVTDINEFVTILRLVNDTEYGEVWYDGHDDYIAFEKIERWMEIIEVG